METNKLLLGNTGKFSTASELCRRNFKINIGKNNRIEILLGKGKKPLKIVTASKQISEWANCNGIKNQDSILIFVDYEGKKELDRPDFYILTNDDWSSIVKNYQKNHPEKKTKIENGTIIFLNEYKIIGKPHKGMVLETKDLEKFKEMWSKIS
jgi:hypothetical protein